MFAHILRLTDLSPQSEASAPLVLALAQATGAHITLLHALEGRPPEHARAALQGEVDTLHAAGVGAELRLEPGGLHEALGALRGDATLLAVGRTGNTGLDRVLLGSSTRWILQHSPFPVLVAGARPFTGLRRVLCPVDLRPDAPQAIAEAASLAHTLGAELTLLHTLAPDAEQSPDEALAELQRRAGRALDPALAASVRVRCEVGYAEVEADAIASRAERAELVVMATHGRRGLPHLLWGSVAEAVAERGPAAVLVLRPL